MKQKDIALKQKKCCFLYFFYMLIGGSCAFDLHQVAPHSGYPNLQTGEIIYNLLHERSQSARSCALERVLLVEKNKDFIVRIGESTFQFIDKLESPFGKDDALFLKLVDSGQLEEAISNWAFNWGLLLNTDLDPEHRFLSLLAKLLQETKVSEQRAITQLLHTALEHQLAQDAQPVSPNTLYYASFIPTSVFTSFCFDGDPFHQSWKQSVCEFTFSRLGAPKDMVERIFAVGNQFKRAGILHDLIDLLRLFFGTFFPKMKPMAPPLLQPHLSSEQAKEQTDKVAEFLHLMVEPRENQENDLLRLFQLLFQLHTLNPTSCQQQALQLSKEDLEALIHTFSNSFPKEARAVLNILYNRDQYRSSL